MSDGSGLKEYRVLTQKDKWFSGRFDSVSLEKMLNEFARSGWTLKSITSSSREGIVLGGNKDELLIVLERDLAVVRRKAKEETPVAVVMDPADEEQRKREAEEDARRTEAFNRRLEAIDRLEVPEEERRRLKREAAEEEMRASEAG